MSENVFLNNWKNRQCVVATMHNKETVISPLLKKELNIHSVVPTNFNTDDFGTFTREKKRTGNQLETARAKARSALELTGLDLAVASEGSFSPHPRNPFIQSNLELLLLIDTKNDLEVIGEYRSSKSIAHGAIVTTAQEATEVSVSWGFPEQGVIVRRSQKSNRDIYKDIKSEAELAQKAEKLLSKLFLKDIYIETDMRAHRCPSRMVTIKEAAINLIKNCKKFCPKCTAPGFVITSIVSGLPCSYCTMPTNLALLSESTCQKCSHVKTESVSDIKEADPGQCQFCNP